VSTKLPLAGAVVTLIGIPGAMASYNFVTTIDPNSSGFTLASGINGGGEVVGSYHSTGVSHGFSFNSGVFSTLDAPSALSTSANGVNGIGQIIGSFTDATGQPQLRAVPRHIHATLHLTPPGRVASFPLPSPMSCT
jgi:uncharacterized membrane protein